MSERPPCKQLFLLVGSNPLPNFLAAIILKPKSVCLFYTPETAPVKDRLEKLLKARGIPVSCRGLGHATDSSEVRERFEDEFSSLSINDHLDYTGGTKVMAAQARMAFGDFYGDDWADKHSSYLDERNAELRFDDGYSISIEEHDILVTIDEVLELHDLDRISKRELAKADNVEEEVKKVALAVLKNVAFVKDLKKISVERYGDIISGLKTDILLKYSDRFQNEAWLEEWVGFLVSRVSPDSIIYIGLESFLSAERKFEVDVVILRHHKMYVISCTAQAKIKPCKLKLFEIAQRSRQLAGDLARCALVCFVDGNDKKQLMDDVRNIWDATNTPEVFSLTDLKEWSGIDGPADTSSLKEWIEK